jgi:hypothetical protein
MLVRLCPLAADNLFFILTFNSLALWLATTFILIRSIYRVVELQGGFNGTVASNEKAFMVLEGPMIILATFLLTIFHPGIAFNGMWNAASWSLREKKSKLEMGRMGGHQLE